MSSGIAELHAACMAAQQATGTENMTRELGVHLDAMELQVDANAAIGIIGRQGLGKLSHVDLSFMWLQSGVRGNQVNLMKVQSESNMAPGFWTAVKLRRKSGQSIGSVTKACRTWRTSLGKSKVRKRVIWKRHGECTGLKQELDTMASTQKSTWN